MRQVTHALLTRPPLSHSSVRKLQSASFDLHVLGTPPAFILSQDQTLMLKFIPVQNLAWLVLNRSTVVFRFCSECSHSWPITKGHFYKNFQGFTYCSVFKVLCCFATARLLYHSFAVLSTAFLFLFLNIQRCLKGRFSVCSFVVEVRSTKLDVVSLRFANDLALSSCFAFTKLLSVKDMAYLSTTIAKSQHLFSKILKLF